MALVAALVTAGPWRAPRTAQAARANREAVLKLLGASERTPNEKELRGLGSDVDAVLIDLARDGKLEPRLRARAVSALAFAPTRASREHLVKLVTGGSAAKDATDVLLVRRAAVALGWQGGPTATPLLGVLLEHADPEVRIDAALALGLTRQASAVEVLRARLQAETDARVRGHISRQLSVIESALGLN
jgi:HEAT repeat protein